MDGPTPIERRMRADLPRAMRARDSTAVTALRTALAAIANAEAPPVESVPSAQARHQLVDHPRLVLTESDVREVIRQEIAWRDATIGDLSQTEAAPAQAEIASLQAQAAVLKSYLH
jgi:uncharacterized protein YqeY